MADQLTVRELIGRILDERVCLSSSLPGVEVDLDAARRFSLFRVDLVLEVDEELLEGIDRAAVGHVADQD